MFSHVEILFQMMWCDLPIFFVTNWLPQWQSYAGEVTHNLGPFFHFFVFFFHFNPAMDK